MSISCDLYVNTGSSDIARGTSGASYVQYATGDVILFSDGNADVADGEAIPTESELIGAAELVGTGVPEHEFEKCFLLDDSTGLIDEIPNAGSGDYRYVFNFYFDGATASEPVLEAWDDTDHDSYDSLPLGAGTPADSWISAVLTTAGSPGASWTGTKISGNGVSTSLQLNGGAGALSAATNVYCNIKCVIPANYTSAESSTPILTVRYSWS